MRFPFIYCIRIAKLHKLEQQPRILFSSFSTARMVVKQSVVIERANPFDAEAIYKITTCNISSNDFFTMYPRGAYTGARTVLHTSIVDLDSHLERLANSLRLIKFNCALSLPTIEGETQEVYDAMKTFREKQSLEKFLIPMLRKGLDEYYIIEQSKNEETKVDIIISYCFENSKPICAAHFCPLPIPPSGQVDVEIEGEPRNDPNAKDSQWVRDRRALEMTKQPTSNDVLLTNHLTGDIYEGISSNFYAVCKPNKKNSKPTVISAPLDYVLQGITMKIVMAVCERDNIPFEWRFPNLSDVDTWEGCFISSTSRLVLPIKAIKFRDGRCPIEFDSVSPTINHIRKEVQNEILKRAYRIL